MLKYGRRGPSPAVGDQRRDRFSGACCSPVDRQAARTAAAWRADDPRLLSPTLPEGFPHHLARAIHNREGLVEGHAHRHRDAIPAAPRGSLPARGRARAAGPRGLPDRVVGSRSHGHRQTAPPSGDPGRSLGSRLSPPPPPRGHRQRPDRAAAPPRPADIRSGAALPRSRDTSALRPAVPAAPDGGKGLHRNLRAALRTPTPSDSPSPTTSPAARPSTGARWCGPGCRRTRSATSRSWRWRAASSTLESAHSPAANTRSASSSPTRVCRSSAIRSTARTRRTSPKISPSACGSTPIGSQ